MVGTPNNSAVILPDYKALLHQIWRQRWLALAIAWALSALFAAAIFAVPNRYEATARVYIDTQTVLKPLMAGLAFQPDIDQQVRMLARTLLSRPNIERLRSDSTIGWDNPKPEKFQVEVDDLLRKIKIDSLGSGNVYVISYRDVKPERAVNVVSTLVKTFFASSNQSKLKDSEEARKFIEDEIRSHEGKLVLAENALKDFKQRNFGFSGVSGQDYYSRVSALADEVSKIRLELTAAEQSRDALRRELSSEPPLLPVEALPGQAVVAPSELDARLDAQRRQLDELLRRFTEVHPDVQSLRRSIEHLEGQKKLELDARKRAAETTGKQLAPTNPAYQRIRVALAEAEASVAALRGRLGAQQAHLDQVRAVANRVPQVEAELTQLNRDYEIIRKNYDQLVARRESASLGEKLDQSSSLAEFRVIDPPRSAPKPVFPDRLSLALLGAVAAVVGGIAAALARSYMNPLVSGIKALQQISGRPVLGSISMLRDAGTLRRERQSLHMLVAASVALLAIQAGWLAWLAMHSRI